MRKLAIKTRGNKTETEHYGFLCLIDAQGNLDKNLCDEYSCFSRSCIKPIQAKICKSILKDELNAEKLCLAVASHLSSPEQIKILRSMLKDFSLHSEELYCGLHSPENKKKYQDKIFHNCAGKHIALLASSKKANLDEAYYKPEHELQKKILDEIKRLSQKDSIPTAVDGCGIPTHFMSLKDLALIFTNASKEKFYQEIFQTTNNYAHLMSAPGRFDQELMQTYPGDFFAKSGADGLILVCKLKTHESLVIKVIDGNSRIKDIVAQNTLENLGWIKKNSLNIDNNIYSSQGNKVGKILDQLQK